MRILENLEKKQVKLQITQYKKGFKRFKICLKLVRSVCLNKFYREVDNDDIGSFELFENQIIFKKREVTEKLTESKIRIGQRDFKTALLNEMSFCPITKIDDKRLLIALVT
ncbi:MAG: hypothetical protein R2771_05675 [Saprospiraceae bacterium]